MALAVSELTSNYDNGNATSYVTASVSPAARAFLYVPYSTTHGTTAPAATISGGGLTWSETEPEQVDGLTAIGSWTAQCGDAPGSFTITLTMDGAVTATGCSWHVIQVTGHQESVPVVQSPIAATGLTGTTATVTFAALADASNAQILHAVHRANESQSAEAGWTAGTSRSGTTPNHSSLATWRVASADLSATQTWTTSARWQAQGIEVKIAVAPTTPPGFIVHYGTGEKSGTSSTSSGTSVTANYPTGYAAVADDYALLCVHQEGSNSAITTPSGYTLLLRTQRSVTHVQALYGRKLANGTAAPTVVVASASALQTYLSIFRGVDATTALDVAATSNTGTSTTTHTGPDIGVLATACAAIVTYASCSDAATINGITLTDDTTISPFTMVDAADGESGGTGGKLLATCGVFHHQIIPSQLDLVRTHTFAPVDPPNPGGGWIATTIALRPADPTVLPVTRDLRAAVRQQTLRTWGTACSTIDTTYQVRFSVQVFDPFNGGGGVWSSGTDGNFWDVEQWSGDGRWEDNTSIVRGVDWQVGADQPGGRPRVGVGSIDLDNQTGAVSPWATSGAYTNGGVSWMRSGLLMRIGSTSSDGASEIFSRTMFTGLVEDIVEHAEQNVDAWIAVTLVEPISTLATHNGIEQGEQGGGEGIYARVDRLLSDALFPYGLYAGDVPAFSEAATFTSTTLAGERLAELYLTADSAGVEFYGYADGGVILNNPLSSAPPRTFSNAPTGGELPVASAQPYANNQRILNAVIGARVDGHEIEVQDGASVSKFGRVDTGNGWPRRDLICQSDTTVAAIVNDVLDFRAGGDTGIGSIVVDADMAPSSLYSHLSFMRLFEPTDIHYFHPSAIAASFTQASYTEGMHHQVTKVGHQMKWICTISLARFPT
jgi:hypothetical protein